MILKLEKVFSGYQKSQPTLLDINLNVTQGETIALVGLNGSGKSTLLKTILGMIPLKSGKILLEGKSLDQWSLKERSKYLSLLPSNPAVYFAMTVKELLDISPHVIPLKDVVALTQIESLLDKNILQLSAGQAQRAFLAHTLAGGSKVVMLDEPFSHLDWAQQIHLAKQLKLWNQKFGTTFLVALHELPMALQFATRIVVLDKGKKVLDNFPKEVLSHSLFKKIYKGNTLIDLNPIDQSPRLTMAPIL